MNVLESLRELIEQGGIFIFQINIEGEGDED